MPWRGAAKEEWFGSMCESESGNMTGQAGLPYVFIIGFNKCGTRSLTHFFAQNGFPTIHWDGGNLARTMMANAGASLPLLQTYDQQFRVFANLYFLNRVVSIEANSFFPALDRDYPESLFIYNTRPMEKWIASRLAHRSPLGESLVERYACATGIAPSQVPAAWEAERRTFEERILGYFSGSRRFLILDIEAPDPATRIADFLGREMSLDGWTWIGRTDPAEGMERGTGR